MPCGHVCRPFSLKIILPEKSCSCNLTLIVPLHKLFLIYSYCTCSYIYYNEAGTWLYTMEMFHLLLRVLSLPAQKRIK
ncbi:hypothetical protein XENTR_v10024415 [Xenopus tropicalis]|nr:hypothetical protein XENTR_v10024415 [Xenopus tropicalis]